MQIPASLRSDLFTSRRNGPFTSSEYAISGTVSRGFRNAPLCASLPKAHEISVRTISSSPNLCSCWLKNDGIRAVIDRLTSKSFSYWGGSRRNENGSSVPFVRQQWVRRILRHGNVRHETCADFSASSVSVSGWPSGSRRFMMRYWNILSANSVFGPMTPSSLPQSKPRLFKRCWTP